MNSKALKSEKSGLFGKLSRFWLRFRIRKAALNAKIDRNRSVEFLKSHPEEALDVLLADLQLSNNKSYLLSIPSLLIEVSPLRGKERCLRLVLDQEAWMTLRETAASVLERSCQVGESLDLETHLARAYEKEGLSDHPSALLLCRTGRPEVIRHVARYLISCPETHRDSIEKALSGLDECWPSSEEAEQLAPALIEAYRSGDRSRRIFVLKLMLRIGSAEFADLLLEAVDDRDSDIARHAGAALRLVTSLHHLEGPLDRLRLLDEEQEEQRRLIDEGTQERLRVEREKKKLEDETQFKKALELKRKIRVGMSLREVETLLGTATSHSRGGDLLGQFGSVTGSVEALSSMSRQSYYVWKRPEGDWKLVFEGLVLVQIHSSP